MAGLSDAGDMSRVDRQAENVLRVVSEVLQAVESGRPADRTLSRWFKEHRAFGAADRRLCREAVFAYFRWRGWLARLPSPALGVAAAYRLEHAQAPPPIVALETDGPDLTGLCPSDTLDAMAAVLGGVFPDAAPFRPDELAPEDVFDHVPPLVQGPRRGDWLSAVQSRPPLWLRAEPDANPAGLQQISEAACAPVRRHERIESAYAVEGAVSAATLSRPECAGLFIQDVSSQAVGEICDPRPGTTWWDACAGAGGKALHLAARMRCEGRIDATDKRSGALTAFRKRLRGKYAQIIRVRNTDALQVAVNNGRYDGVLVDAPCSGIGTWSRNPDARWRFEAGRIGQSVQRQERLLAAAAQAVKPGGRLVYAVCTLSVEETDGVCDAFGAAQGAFTPEPFEHPMTGEPCKTARAWIFPWDGPCNGMFMARWTRSATG